MRLSAPRSSSAGILYAGAFACLSVSAYFAYFYLWTHSRQFTSARGPLLYLLFPLALAFFLFAAGRSAYRQYVALSFVSAVISVYAFDAMLPLVHRLDTRFDHRTTVEVIDTLSRRGIEAVPAVFASPLLHSAGNSPISPIDIDESEALPLAGISHATTVACNESGQYLIYENDEHGFHNPSGSWQSSQASMVAVGDSFTLGVCVPSEHSFVGVLRTQYKRVLNLGMDGAGPLIELAALREYAAPFRPPIVLWFYFELNDPSDLSFEQQKPLLMRYLDPGFSQDLIHRQPELDNALRQYLEEQRQRRRANSSSVDAFFDVLRLRELREYFGLVQSRDTAQRYRFELNGPLFSDIMMNARDLVHSWNGQLYFVYLPTFNRYDDLVQPEDREDTQKMMAGKDEVLKLVQGLRIPVIDIEHAFRVQPDPKALFPFRRIGHYNEDGHRLVADAVSHALFD